MGNTYKNYILQDSFEFSTKGLMKNGQKSPQILLFLISERSFDAHHADKTRNCSHLPEGAPFAKILFDSSPMMQMQSEKGVLVQFKTSNTNDFHDFFMTFSKHYRCDF